MVARLLAILALLPMVFSASVHKHLAGRAIITVGASLAVRYRGTGRADKPRSAYRKARDSDLAGPFGSSHRQAVNGASVLLNGIAPNPLKTDLPVSHRRYGVGKVGRVAPRRHSYDCVRRTDIYFRCPARGLPRTRHACARTPRRLTHSVYGLMTATVITRFQQSIGINPIPLPNQHRILHHPSAFQAPRK